MLKIALLTLLLSRAAVAASPAAPEFLTVKAVAWDPAWKPASAKDWADRVVSEVASAAKDGADVILFPEGFSKDRALDGVLTAVKDAAGADRLVVLGNAPHLDPGADHAVLRAYILSAGSWQTMDKLDPTPAERARKPPVRNGLQLPLFRFRGGIVAALPAYSVEKPEIAASLKRRALQLLLVSAPADDAAGAARVARCAAARAIELGAAVVVASPAPSETALHLPAQTGFELAPQAPAKGGFRIPWRKLLDLRTASGAQTEARPFLDPAPHFQVEL
jgi:predicted amidohydrolase